MFGALVLLLCGLLASGVQPAHAQSVRLSPEVQLEGRLFPSSPQFADQFQSLQGGLVFTGEARWRSKDRATRATFEPYLRLDSEDGERTYFDIREASITHRLGDTSLLVGVGQVFWGVAESRNVVDVINQFDTIEDVDQTEKLGQPMVRLSQRLGPATIDVYYLPYFRQQRFPGQDGRLRGPLSVEASDVVYERDGGRWAGDVAARYYRRLGSFDLGLHVFKGTDRSAFLRFNEETATLTPIYQGRTQGGIDLQYTSGPWLLKLEAVGVGQADQTFASVVAGFEYTFFDIARSGLDIGLIGEYLHDGRTPGDLPQALFQDDVFVGTRWALNDVQDTELLAGAIIDARNGGIFGSIEFQRRIGSATLLEVEARAFRQGSDEALGFFQKDEHATVRVTRYF